MFSTDAEQWAKDTFQHSELGDSRRTRRLVKLASSLANHLGQSLVQSLKSPADIEAAYRFTRNQAIDPQAIAEAGFAGNWSSRQGTMIACSLLKTRPRLSSPIVQCGGDGAYHIEQALRGMHAHSVLAVCAG